MVQGGAMDSLDLVMASEERLPVGTWSDDMNCTYVPLRAHEGHDSPGCVGREHEKNKTIYESVK